MLAKQAKNMEANHNSLINYVKERDQTTAKEKDEILMRLKIMEEQVANVRKVFPSMTSCKAQAVVYFKAVTKSCCIDFFPFFSRFILKENLNTKI